MKKWMNDYYFRIGANFQIKNNWKIYQWVRALVPIGSKMSLTLNDVDTTEWLSDNIIN